MKAELREQLGKAAYNTDLGIHHVWSPKDVSWEDQSKETQERYRNMAEGVVQELCGMMVIQLQYVAMALTDRPIEITLGEKVAQWPKKEVTE